MKKMKLNFTIPQDSYDALQALRKKSGRTVDDIMKEAIRVYTWAKEESQKGRVIISKSPTEMGVETEVIL